MRFKLESSFADGWEVDTICKKCGNNKSECTCPSAKNLAAREHSLYVKTEKRKGKTVSLVGEFFISEKELKKLSKTLKANLACGGSIEGNILLFQGDVTQKAKELIKAKGYRFKK